MTDYSAIIRDHLTQQKARAIGRNGTSCQYKAFNGNKCAVGCLIPDELYSEGLEGQSIAAATYRASNPSLPTPGFYEKAKLLFAALPADLDMDVAVSWQRYHDSTYSLPFAQGFRLFCYAGWLDGDDTQSPAAFYDALAVALADKAEVQP